MKDMSELINNQSKKEKKLKDLIKRLHNNEGNRDEIEAEFKSEFGTITGAELAQMEYNLVQEGVSIEEIQSLCDVHASIFKGSLQQLHSDMLTVNPLSEFEEDNEKIAQWVENAKAILEKEDLSFEEIQVFVSDLTDDFTFTEKHYAKKENILFPFLEKRGIDTIPQVMWGVDNQIREGIRKAKKAANEETSAQVIKEALAETVHMVDEMLVKENNILFPMLQEKLQQDEIKDIALSLEHGANEKYQPKVDVDEALSDTDIPMSLGRLNPEEINAIFNTVPFDMTYVDASDRVKFVTQGKERIFDRPPSVINRPVHLCHPPQSVDVVLDIVNDLRTGKKDNEDFWIQFRERFVHIRYFAVRNPQGKFLGTLEVTQDITDIQSLIGEKRLVEK